MTNKDIVRDYYDAWASEDKSKLHLHPELKHESKDTNFKSRAEFLDACWGKVPATHHKLLRIIEEGNQVCVLFKFSDADNYVSEWFTVEDGLIREIRVVY